MQHPGQAGTRRFEAEMSAIWAAVLETPGDCAHRVREAAFAVGQAVAAGEQPAPAELPVAVAPVVEKIARHAWKVTDADVQRLKAAGCSEDAIFELTVATAAGAGLARLDRALRAFDQAGGHE